MEDKTIVLPSARAIRQKQLSLEEKTLFLPSYLTMNEFISKLCIVDGFTFMDEDTRVLLLFDASDFKNFTALQIERNFFTFTKNSSYIFKFFSELSAELYDINLLKEADVYSEYEEHIHILIELHHRYEKICYENRYLDPIFLPKLYKFNEAYAKSHSCVEINVEGHLTNFEIELLMQAKEFTEIYLLFTTSRFNLKMQNKLNELGFVLEVGYRYKLSLNTEKIIEATSVIKNKNIICESVSEVLLEVAFVKNKIYEFIQKGYKAEAIAVILPDESMANLLKSFDEKANLNFAMGLPFTQSEIFLTLQATIKAIELQAKENEARLNRVGNKIYTKLYPIYYKKAKDINFTEFLYDLKELFTHKDALKIFDEEIYHFQRINVMMETMNVKSLLNLFMQRLSLRTLDDIRGGKITVMGVLETRAVAFDAVIILDFDDTNVPKRSDKDMFLNSAIREFAKLPTMSDRENLQKHYYEALIHASKEVAICYVNSKGSQGSRFLKQLSIKETQGHSEHELITILFPKSSFHREKFLDRTLPYSFKNIKLSSTRLKTYLRCKREYYFRYIEKIKSHSIPKDMPEEYEIGNAVHLALKELYQKQKSYNDIVTLRTDLHQELDRVCGESELDKYLIALQKKLLEKFLDEELQRFQEGWSVLHVEELFEVSFHGITLIGYIDRVDKRGGEIEVLDYKTGTYTLYNEKNLHQATDFQLEFYHILTAGLGDDIRCGFYDLRESRIVPEQFLSEKLALLREHINELLKVEEIETTMCEDLKLCQRCEYNIMCGRSGVK